MGNALGDGVTQSDALVAAAPAPAVVQAIDWQALIAAAMASAKTTTKAHTFVRLYRDDSKPVELICEDGHTYVVKCLWADVANRPPEAEIKDARLDGEQGRRMFNDQTCARLGAAMGAAVPTVGLIEITDELIKANPQMMGHLKPCTAHGSRKLSDVSGRVGGFDHADKGDNRERYACLSVFYSWLAHGDMQFLRGNQPPHSVYSHDHGHFFPDGPMWTEASLSGYSAAPAPAHEIVTGLQLKPSETMVAGDALKAVTVENIVQAIGASPDEWMVPLADRVALANFVHDRQTLLVKSLPPSNGATP
jgi:hypothetical protein